jgi:tetratricopeptide (TPR) repeat protein
VALWYSGERAAALKSFEESIGLDPAAAEVYSFLGMARRETGELDRARLALQRSIALNPNLPAPYFDLGLVFLRSGQLEKGIGQIEAALNLPASAGPAIDLDVVVSELRRRLSDKPDLPEGHNILGLLLGKQGADPKQVIQEFREAVRLRPDYAEAHNNLGLVLTQVGDGEKGIVEFREALRYSPESAGALGNLGAALVWSQPAEAVRLLEKAVAVQPAFVRAQYNLALAYAQSPQHVSEKAIPQFQKVIDREPGFAAAHFELGKLLFRNNALPEAITHFRQAVRLDPKLGSARYQLGLALTRAGQPAEGAAEIEKSRAAIEEESKLETAGQLIGEARAALDGGQNEAAIATLQNLVRLLPSSTEAHHQLGLALLAQGDRAGATASFEKALEIDPQYTPAREVLQRALSTRSSSPGTTLGVEAAFVSPALGSNAPPDDPQKVRLFEDYIRRRQFKEVEPLILDYLKVNPNSWWASYVLGYALFAQRRIGDSIAALASSLELNTGNADAHRLLGRDLMVIGRFDEAQTELELAVKLNPQRPEIRYDLGKIYSAHDNYPPARRELEEAIRIDPSYMEAHDALGLVMEALGDDNAALSHYKKSAEINESRGTSYSSPYINLAAYYNRLGDPKQGLANARRALQMNPKSDAGNFQLGKALDRLQEWSEAVQALNRAIEANPRASSYHYVLSGVYRRLGKSKESQEQMEIFRRLEKEAAEFEQKRREARREESRQSNRSPR